MKKKIVLGILIVTIVGLTIISIGYMFYKKEVRDQQSQMIPTKIEQEISSIEISTKIEKDRIFNTTATIEDVKVAKDQKNIYLFYGDGCPYCEQEIKFLEELYHENTLEFNLYAFEVWHTKENKEFLEKVSETLNTNSDLIPMLVIGHEAIIGFSEKTKETIKTKLSKEQTRDIYEEIYKN